MRTTLILVTLLMASVVLPVSAQDENDFLYIGDVGDNSVKRFDAKTGTYLKPKPLVPSQGNGLIGPMGLLRKGNELLVVNQNLNQPFNGEVLRFNRKTGAFQGALIPCREDLNRPCDEHSPFAPRGMVKGPGSTLFVADHFGSSFDFQTQGSVKQYDFKTGQFAGELDTTGFRDKFFPRGVVIGPDGKLYVSVVGVLGPPTLPGFDPLAGYVLRFNAETGKFIDVFASHQPSANDCSTHLHRPEGLVFGPDGKLYVTSFRADDNDTDKILVFDEDGQCLEQDRIDLDQVGQARATAQAILFGPRGRLFVPITNAGFPPDNPFTGEVRRYNVNSKKFDIFVPSAAKGGPLLNPWYLTFGETDPSTLEYDD